MFKVIATVLEKEIIKMPELEIRKKSNIIKIPSVSEAFRYLEKKVITMYLSEPNIEHIKEKIRRDLGEDIIIKEIKIQKLNALEEELWIRSFINSVEFEKLPFDEKVKWVEKLNRL